MRLAKTLKVCASVGPATELHVSDAKHDRSNKKTLPAFLYPKGSEPFKFAGQRQFS